MGGGRLYTYLYAVTTRMTSALRWAAMRDILMFHNCEGQSYKPVSADHNLKARSQEMASYSTYPGADGKTKADRKKSRYLSGQIGKRNLS